MLYQPIAATTYCMCRVLAPNLGGFSVADDVAGVGLLDRPGRREAALGQGSTLLLIGG